MFQSPHVRWFYHAIVLLLMTTSAHSSDLTLITRYGDTGGLAGNLNNVGDQINGRNICTVANDYTNVAPGCDMGADPGYVANGPGADDDTYNGDLIVRTNDEFEVIAAYSWLGNAGGAEERVTITGVLPAGTGFIWSQIPGSCDVGLSSISVDQKTIVCVRVDFDPFDVGSFAEDFSLPVRVEGDAINGSTPGDIVVTIDAPDSASGSGPITDGVEDGTAANLIKVTASPRWNIDKSGGAGYYTLQAGRQDDLANPGWWIWYNFTIEVDEVNGETDSAINPLLGNEALLGGTNATVSFTDDLSAISPNAKIVTWDTNGNFDPVANACTMEVYTNGDEPFPSFNAANPERSIQVDAGGIGVGMDVTCTQVGSAVNVVVSGMDGTLSKAPRRNRNGGFLPVNRSIAAIGTMRVFVPLSDVVNAGGTLNTTNCLTDFYPLGISGGANFAGAGESEVDNCRNLTLNAAAGSWDKNFRKGWSDRADQIAQWGGGGWSLPPTDASVVEGGDGTITPGGVFGTYTVYNNTGGSDIANPTLCDVIDVETYEMTLLNPTTDDAGTFVDDRIHAVDLNYSTTESVPGLTIEYATGYVGSWPPNPFEAPSANAPDEVVAECSDPGITWYPDLVAAETADGAPVSKVRISAPTLPPGLIMAMRIKHTARANFLTSGLPIPNNTILVNHATYRSALTSNNYRAGDYFPRDASLSPGNASGGGDRLIMVRAKARIIKSMNPTNVSPGSESTVTLMTSFTTDGSVSETDNVSIADLLPNGLNYKNGTTTGTYDGGTPYGEPLVISPVTDLDCNTHVPDIVSEGHPCGTLNGGTGNETILVWDLGPVVTGTVMGDLDFVTFVAISAPSGTLQNYAQISSPADTSESSKRVSNANVNNSVPSSLLIVKEVLTPLHEVNTDPLLNWMQFRVGVRNGSSGVLTDLDVIDILPFNGDGVSGSFTFSPSPTVTVNRQRLPATSYNGDFEFDSMSFDDNGGVCSAAVEFWFTDDTGTLDISPVNPANVIPGGAVNWCQGTTTGPAGTCGFTNTEVTAIRTRGATMNPAATCFLNVSYATSNNIDEDIYSNTAGAKATGVTNAVLSNTVSAVVFAGSIGDTIWYDINNDGMVDANEPLAGITVSITPPAGVDLGNGPGVAITSVTDVNGNYLFDNLPAGEYTVAVDESTLPIALQGNNTIDPDGGNDSISVYNLGDDEDNLDQDFAYYVPSSIGDTIWHDMNNDGVVDAGEALSGITVSLTPPAGIDLGNGPGVAITTMTDINGNYLFEELPAGDYVVTVDESTLPVTLQGNNSQDPDGGNDSTSAVTLGVGEQNLDQDFAYFVPGSIGDTIYQDLNNDGIIDAGEGIPNVTVILTPPANIDLGNGPGVAITTTTDANGNYNFGDLPPGDYVVTVDESTLPPALQGNNTQDPDGGNNSTSSVSLAEGEDNPDQDFGYFAPGSIGDTIWFDMNNDGVVDAGEALPNITVTLTPPAGVDLGNGPGVAITTMTDANGNYLFPNLPPGNYVVTVDESTLPVALQGNNSIDPDGGNNSTSMVSLAVGENNLDQDFAYFVPGSIGDTIYNDQNNDGIIDAGEGIANVIVTLTPPAGIDLGNGPGVAITTTTDGNGNYNFGNLPPGDYVVTVDESTLPPALQGNNTQDPDGGNNSTSNVSLGQGENNPDQDFGYFTAGVIGDTVWFDRNNDGVYFIDEGLAGITVTLTPPAGIDLGNGPGVAISTTTDANGNYLFDNLPAGQYTVTIDQSTLPQILQVPGANTVDPDGGFDSTSVTTITAGGSDLDQDFAYYLPVGINLDKTVYATHNSGASCPGSELVQGAAGNDVTYCFEVTNTGQTYLDTIAITDTDISVTQTDLTLLTGTLPLAPGDSISYYYDATMTASLLNTAQVVGIPTDSNGDVLPGNANPVDFDTAEVEVVGPGIGLDKTVYLNHDAGASCATAGDAVNIYANTPVTYCFVVTNTGNTFLGDIGLNDATLSIDETDMTLLSGTFPLAQNAQAVYFYQTTATTDLVNTADVTANPVDSLGDDIVGLPDVTDIDTATVNLLVPEMTLNKSVYAGINGGVSCPGTGSLNLTAPSDVTFCFIVTNTGQVDLDDVMINDITFAVTDADMVLVSGTLPLEPNDTIVWAYETFLSEGINNEAIATANPVDETGTDIPPLIDEEDNDVAIVTIGALVSVPVPALSQWALLLMALLMVGIVFRRRQV